MQCWGTACVECGCTWEITGGDKCKQAKRKQVAAVSRDKFNTHTDSAVTELSTPGVMTCGNLCPQQLRAEFADSSFKRGDTARANGDGNG